MDGVDLDYRMPQSVVDLLSTSRTTQMFDIHSVSPMVHFTGYRIQHLCGKKAYVKVCDISDVLYNCLKYHFRFICFFVSCTTFD